MPAGHAVVVLEAPRASHITTESRGTLQVSAPGTQARTVHAAETPLPVQSWLVAAQSVVVREVPVALHSTSTSPLHVRLPATQVVGKHSPATQVSVPPQAVTLPQLSPSAAQT